MAEFTLRPHTFRKVPGTTTSVLSNVTPYVRLSRDGRVIYLQHGKVFYEDGKEYDGSLDWLDEEIAKLNPVVAKEVGFDPKAAAKAVGAPPSASVQAALKTAAKGKPTVATSSNQKGKPQTEAQKRAETGKGPVPQDGTNKDANAEFASGSQPHTSTDTTQPKSTRSDGNSPAAAAARSRSQEHGADPDSADPKPPDNASNFSPGAAGGT